MHAVVVSGPTAQQVRAEQLYDNRWKYRKHSSPKAESGQWPVVLKKACCNKQPPVQIYIKTIDVKKMGLETIKGFSVLAFLRWAQNTWNVPEAKKYEAVT